MLLIPSALSLTFLLSWFCLTALHTRPRRTLAVNTHTHTRETATRPSTLVNGAYYFRPHGCNQSLPSLQCAEKEIAMVSDHMSCAITNSISAITIIIRVSVGP